MQNSSEVEGSAERTPTFVDAFAGCGGLSLGLMEAGWQGMFAIEKDPLAFETLQANFLSSNSRHLYNWPNWLDQEPLSIYDLMGEMYVSQLDKLRGKVDLLAGGPPCQGFSSAGRRDPNDPRNRLVDAYLELVKRLEPDMVLLENVRGITYKFTSNSDSNEEVNYSKKLIKTLSKDYAVFTRIIKASGYGVPQNRPRFFMIAMRKGVKRSHPRPNPFTFVSAHRDSFFQAKGLKRRPSACSAISDLEVLKNGDKDCPECKGFKAIDYKEPKTAFQKAMRIGFDGPPSDTRMARHQPHIVDRFTSIINHCKANKQLYSTIPKELRERFGLKKQVIRVIDPRRPSPTITSMPDDLIHYSEPRALTVRENARLQTFPDWFVFKGKYTTGGHRRKLEVPRFTQVANAVPPLLAELLGESLLRYLPSEQTWNN
ncbi:MAG: DNA cytosine methyltransferase [Magnetococcales bacterium]|nr:DNA cytosine methyltransferase [Magnetococcales bacterium]